MSEFETRSKEQALADDPAEMKGDGHIVFIGRVSSPWTAREECPKNLRQARERGQSARLEIDPAYRAGLTGLTAGRRIIILSWLNRAPRNLIIQHPRHREDATGVFDLRSPVRPNPVGLHTVTITAIDHETGRIDIDAIDLLDGTPVIDIKPYLPTVDVLPDETDGVG